MSYDVFFASKKVGTELYLGVSVFDDFEQAPPQIKKVPVINGTFYEEDLMAFKYALEHVLDEGYDDVTLQFHNQLLFEWLERRSHKNKMRDMLYKRIKKLFREIVAEGTTIGYELVRGKDNEAKKELDKELKDIKQGGDLTSMFTSAEVVDFSREVRERSN